MESARAQYAVDRVDAEGYEPDLIEGAQVGEFHQLEPVGSADKLDVCVWRTDPATYDYLFENDEAFHVVEVRPQLSLPTATSGSTCGRGTLRIPVPAHDQSGRSRSRSKSSR